MQRELKQTSKRKKEDIVNLASFEAGCVAHNVCGTTQWVVIALNSTSDYDLSISHEYLNVGERNERFNSNAHQNSWPCVSDSDFIDTEQSQN